MAIYHLHASIVSRGKGHSAVAAAAYRSGEEILDRRTGEEHDYSRRSGVDHTEIIAPDDAPDWTRERAELWNQAEAAERRQDAQVAREVRVALPVELGDEDRRQLVRDFVSESFVSRGMVADVAYHDGDGRNPHAHILLTTRPVAPDDDGFSAKKDRSWNSRETLEDWRESWATAANRALERAERWERIDHRTLEAQRDEALDRGDLSRAATLDREPGVHLGRASYAMAVRGEVPERFERALAADQENERLEGERQGLRERWRDLEHQINRILEAAQRELHRFRRGYDHDRDDGPEWSR